MVASFFLPVTLTKRTDVVSSDADGQETADVWTAEWDNEQLVALQVRGGDWTYSNNFHSVAILQETWRIAF